MSPRDGAVGPQAKHPPHSVEMEQSVLGGLMFNAAAWFELEAMQLVPDDFFTQDHRVIFQSIGELVRAGKPCDFVALSDHLRMRDRLEEAGGSAYLGTISVDYASSAANVKHYGQRVKEFSLQRALIAVGHDIATLGYESGGQDADALTAEAERLLSAVNARGAVRSKKFHELAEEAIDAFEDAKRQRERGKIVGARTGLETFDRISGGFHGPRLIVLAARPKCGKTALLNSIALATCGSGTPGYVCSIEMGNNETAARLLSRSALVNLSRLQLGEDDAVSRAVLRLGEISDLPLWMDFDTYLLESIVAQIVLHRIKFGIEWAAVDHIGLVRTREQFRNNNDRLGHISWTLKQLCKRLGIPIIALSQLSRTCDSEGRRPRADDLRDSGNIEQDADMVVMAHVPLGERTKFVRKAQLGITANRAGPACWIPCGYEFDGAHQRFQEVSSAPPAEGQASPEDYIEP